MRFLVKVSMPLEPFNTYVRDGSAQQKMETILGELKPEAGYFTAFDGNRTALLIVNLDEVSQIPSIAEPWFLQFNANVEFDAVMVAEDLAKANLHELGAKWK